MQLTLCSGGVGIILLAGGQMLCLLPVTFVAAQTASAVVGFAYVRGSGTLSRSTGEARNLRAVEALRDGVKVKLLSGSSAIVQLDSGRTRFALAGPATFRVSPKEIALVGTGSPPKKLPPLPSRATKVLDKGTKSRVAGARLRGGEGSDPQAPDEFAPWIGPAGMVLGDVLTVEWPEQSSQGSIRVSFRIVAGAAVGKVQDIQLADRTNRVSGHVSLEGLPAGVPLLIRFERLAPNGTRAGEMSRRITRPTEPERLEIVEARSGLSEMPEKFERLCTWTQIALGYGLYTDAIAALEEAGKEFPESREALGELRREVERLAFGRPRDP